MDRRSARFGGDARTQTDVFMTGRTTGYLPPTVATELPNFGWLRGLNFCRAVPGKNDYVTAYESNGDGFGLSATYEYEGFGVGAAYARNRPY